MIPLNREFAIYNEKLYEAGLVGDGQTMHLDPLLCDFKDQEISDNVGLQAIDVAIASLQAWFVRSVYFSWRERKFAALGIDTDSIYGMMVHADAHWAFQNGLIIHDRSWVEGTFQRSDVDDVHEEHEDLLARHRR